MTDVKKPAFWYVVGMAHARAIKVPKYYVKISSVNNGLLKPVKEAFQELSGEKGIERTDEDKVGRMVFRVTRFSRQFADCLRDACGNFDRVPLDFGGFKETS